MCDLRQNGSFHVAVDMNWIIESKRLRLQVVNFWIQPSESSIRVNVPKRNNPEGERGVRNTWIAQGLYNNALFHEAV
jgi:hypothetical protein